VLPGITGLWQVSGRSNLSFEEMLELDLQYVERRSLWLDLTIIAKTLPAMVSRKGAY
jgi:lipopolysaccharide/colanic/teichoic acid biosynthesis glycosyltransferase